jgi:putative DNA primase/helicase
MNAKKAFYTDPDNKPNVLRPCLDAVPDELRTVPRWVLWKLVWKNAKKSGKGVWDKVPYRPNARKAKSNDPKTWASFEEVVIGYQKGGYDGIGFMFSDPFAGIDLDNVRNPETGEVSRRDATELIERFATYTEISPSGTGLKLFGLGKWSVVIGAQKGPTSACNWGPPNLFEHSQVRLSSVTVPGP